MSSHHFKHAIPALLTNRRKALGLTLQELGTAANLSAAFISQAERGLTTPSISSLMKLSNALNVDINYFISPPTIQSLFHYADKDQMPISKETINITDITSNIKNNKLNNNIITIPPHSNWHINDHNYSECVIYILSGKLTSLANGKAFSLGKGDSAHFDQYSHLSFSNNSAKPVTLICVMANNTL